MSSSTSNLDNAYALLIGVGKDLPASARDAEAIANLLSDPDKVGYKPENIQLLVEKQATRKGILDAFDTLIDKTDEDSSVLLFYSGHGGTYTDNDIQEWEHDGKDLKPEEENETHYFWVPNDYNGRKYRDTWVLATELKEKLASLKTRRLILVLDCCHAGGMTKSSPGIGKASLKDRLTNPEGMIHKMDDGRGMSILSSCRAEERSWIIPKDAENSLFTECLLEVLEGKHHPDFKEPYVRMTDVINHVMRKVPEVKSVQRPFVTLQMFDNFILSKNILKDIQETVKQYTESKGTEKEATGEVLSKFRENHGVNAAVFVHGFSGEAHKSFGEVPKLLAQDSDMDGWDLFPLGFSQNNMPEMGHDIWASSLDLQKLADNIASGIRHKFEDYKRVALVGHSLGGLAIQMAMLQLKPEERSIISHIILMATPNKGILAKDNKEVEKRHQNLFSTGTFIQNLRKEWNASFSTPDFTLKNAVGTDDNLVGTENSFGVFDVSSDVLVAGDHFSMVQPEDTDHDGYQLICKTLTDNTFSNKYTNKEEINLLLGDYEAVVRELWPDRKNLGNKGTRNLIFALEGLDRLDDAIDFAESQANENESLYFLGLLAGRVKRRFLKYNKEKDGDRSFDLYKKAFDMAVDENNIEKQYFLAINLAFMSIVHHQDRAEMTKYATLSRKRAQEDPFESIWKAATIAEASIYLADFSTAKEQYTIAAAEAGPREKISMHANACLAYTTLTRKTNDEFVRFLNGVFLN
ncbi:caspase family protein [Nonlabens agnitus]|uniref:Uncharacterized protein n=1 Tax=Nonlabens agnitus TaxID=870484 RepID=A0A2S9WSN8_9FLAO|nr:caspase family protein [Nonlabens agnitus]PRP66498.1 hypothetical protein BST86_05010 [Nonlabens agnitus]